MIWGTRENQPWLSGEAFVFKMPMRVTEVFADTRLAKSLGSCSRARTHHWMNIRALSVWAAKGGVLEILERWVCECLRDGFAAKAAVSAGELDKRCEDVWRVYVSSLGATCGISIRFSCFLPTCDSMFDADAFQKDTVWYPTGLWVCNS